MKRSFLSVVGLAALLSVSPKALADSIIPPTFYSRLYLINVQHSQQRALFRTQVQMQQLRQRQLQRALRGQAPTPAMLEQARRLQLQNAAREQMLRGAGRAIRQNRANERHWEWSRGRRITPW